MEPIQITDARGYIVDRAIREAYDRIFDANRGRGDPLRTAEAFLRLVERFAARGRRVL